MSAHYKTVGPSLDAMRINAGGTPDASWPTSTPKNYEKTERKAIVGEAKSKGSTSFKFGANAKDTPDPHYSKASSPEERKIAASNIKKELHGTTGQERATKRAELMDPGPSDDAKPKLGPKQWPTKTPKNYESKEREAIKNE
jgi:hypothetical protein